MQQPINDSVDFYQTGTFRENVPNTITTTIGENTTWVDSPKKELPSSEEIKNLVREYEQCILEHIENTQAMVEIIAKQKVSREKVQKVRELLDAVQKEVIK